MNLFNSIQRIIFWVCVACLGGCQIPSRTAISPHPSTGEEVTDNRETLGVDSRFKKYHEYLVEMINSVQANWYGRLGESRVSPPRGSRVTVTFKLNSKGETEFVNVEDKGCGKLGVAICENAIQYGQPYRQWTKAMIAELGDEQTITFAFYYQ